MDDAMQPLDEDDIEEEADSEVEKVLWELTEGKLGEAPRAVDDSLPAVSKSTKVAGKTATKAPALKNPDNLDDPESDEDMETMRKRLEQLKS